MPRPPSVAPGVGAMRSSVFAVLGEKTARRGGGVIPRAPYFVPEGGAYVFVRHGGADLWELLDRLVDEGVAVAPGEAFGAAYGGYFRVCFTAVPPAQLAEGCQRLMRVLDRG